MKRIHVHSESDEFDEEEAQHVQCKDRRQRAPFLFGVANTDSKNWDFQESPPRESPHWKALPNLVKSTTPLQKVDFDKTYIDGKSKKRPKTLKTTCSCVNCQLSKPMLRNMTHLVPSRSVRCYSGGAAKESRLWHHRPRSLPIGNDIHLNLTSRCGFSLNPSPRHSIFIDCA